MASPAKGFPDPFVNIRPSSNYVKLTVAQQKRKERLRDAMVLLKMK